MARMAILLAVWIDRAELGTEGDIDVTVLVATLLEELSESLWPSSFPLRMSEK